MSALVLPTPTPCGELLCQKDTYARSTTATVVSCEAAAAPPAPKGKKKNAKKAAPAFDVVLSDTVLFPEGGGQPSDVGTVGGVQANRVDNVDGVAIHRLAAPLDVGAEVDVVLDWDRRWDHATQHTAQHLASALALDWLGAPTLSWALGETTSAIEFGPPFTADRAAELETRVDASIREGASIKAEWHDAAAVTSGDVAGLRASSCKLPESVKGPVRVVRLGDVDVNPCCGTHVATTAHLQGFKVVKTEKKKANTLVHFVAGPRVSTALGACLSRERRLCDALCAAPDQLPDRVQTALDKAKDAEARARALQGELVEALAATLAASTSRVVAAPPRDARDMADFGKSLASAVEAAAPDKVLIQTFAPGSFLLSTGAPETLEAAKAPILAALEGKGGGKGARFQGKCGAVGNVAAAAAAATAALEG